MSRRVLPHNVDAEASILGGILLRNEVLADLPALEVDDFYDHRHKVVFQAMRNLEAIRRPIDVVTLEVEIERQGKLAAIAGVAFLGELALRVPTPDNVAAYAEIVAQKSRARRLMLALSDVVERGYEDGHDVDEMFNEAMGAIARLDRARPDTSATIAELARRRIPEIDELAAARARGEVKVVGIPTGIAALDERIGGYPFGDLTLLCARPGMGKSAMIMAAADAATTAGFATYVVAGEGGWRMYTDRALARKSQIAVERIRVGDIDALDAAPLVRGAADLCKRDNWIIDNCAGLTAQEIIRRARRHRARKGVRFVVVDYVQILKRARGLEHNENAAYDEMVTAFAGAAVDDDMTYLVVSQLNRKVEDRTDKRPQMADLRGSGALEERPRVIVSPYRGFYYYREPKKGIDFDCDCLPKAPCPHGMTREEFESSVQILILKNNNGATGTVTGHWRAHTTEMW